MAQIYLTQQQYEDQFGEDELVRLTDDDANGTVNSEVFDEAVADASADMDAYLGQRYTLPFEAPIPRLLKSIAASLTREKLHSAYPTDAVTEQAKLARSQLRDLSTGKAVLTVDETGEQPETNNPKGTGIDYRTSGQDQFSLKNTASFDL